MKASDLLTQVRRVAEHLAGRRVAFVGDYDCANLMLSLLRSHGFPCPEHMLVLDFDVRLLTAIRSVAEDAGLADLIDVRPYNVFDPIPVDLLGKYDWFYTNPPYGSRNLGESVRLFVTRGIELCRPDRAEGCLILPDDAHRPWTRQAWRSTRAFLHRSGWSVQRKIDGLHRYHLDDDAGLTSSTFLLSSEHHGPNTRCAMPFAGRRVRFEEIPHFYGMEVEPPYPRYILADGSSDRQWAETEE
jgi:N4-bis(aminopropyl)spermidine synthase